jgi:serine protease AprX
MQNQQGSRKLSIIPAGPAKRRWRFSTVALAGISLVVASSVFCQTAARGDAFTEKSDLFLSRKAGLGLKSGWSSVIVKFRGGLTSAHDVRVKALGGYVYRHLPVIGAAAVRVPNRNFARLAAMPDVERLSADLQVKKTDEFTVEHSGAGVAFDKYRLTGKGVLVAVLDAGMNPDHGDLEDYSTGKSRVVGSTSLVPGDSNTTDKCGHGMHVAGAIGGNGNSSNGRNYFRTFYGIAREVSLANIRVLDGQGRGNVSDVIAGIQMVTQYAAQYKIRVMNLSLGHPVGESYTTDPLCQAVEAAWKAGVVVVCSAGNNGRVSDTKVEGMDNEGYGTAYGSIQSPGNDPYVITVGAMKSTDGTRANDRIATYSSRGPTRLDFVMKPDIVAPGNQVVSLNSGNSYLESQFGATNAVKQEEYVKNPGRKFSVKYYRLSGTSMAAPVVSGAVALMLQKEPTLTPDTVKARLMLSADKLTLPNGDGDPCTFGAGYLNIPAALECKAVATQSALSPSVYQDLDGTVRVNIDRAIWGEKALWGTQITDLRAIWGEKALWGTNAIWGCADTLSSSRAVWGTAFWMDNAIWGTTSSSVDLSCRAIFGE